jgi:hypothetical protein
MATPAEQQAAANEFIQEVWGLQGVAYLVVALRYYSQLSSFGRRVQWDDVLMLLATVSSQLSQTITVSNSMQSSS